jgi:concentrative nucleoside transporter, CNT family
MNEAPQAPDASVPMAVPPHQHVPLPPLPPTPLWWRLVIAAAVFAVGMTAYELQPTIGTRGQSVAGVFCFFGLIAMFSANLRAVSWKTIFWGVALQLVLALLVLRGQFTLNGEKYSVYNGFERAGVVVKQFISFSDKGAEFVFGNLADRRPAEFGGTWSRLFPGKNDKGEDNYLFQFAFVALPPILFVSAFFTVLYHFGVLQFIVRVFARGMVYLLGTSGAETLSVAANVFMGQTEAPLIVRPYVPRMTNSELFTLMTSGFAHISGGMMVVYINYGANPVAVLTTCIMACPCSLYLSKLFMPETSVPETAGTVHQDKTKSPYANAIDAAASGTRDGLGLAFNVAAMLIVFTAFVYMFDAILGGIKPTALWAGLPADWFSMWPDDLSLGKVFAWLFAPAAFLMGVDPKDVPDVARLLGQKLSINEHFAYLQMKKLIALPILDANGLPNLLRPTARSFRLAAFALTGFANFASVGIQLGGIGAMAPERRHDLARLAGRALFVGFVATLLNAAIAGVLLTDDNLEPTSGH